jgi:beta-galactosidase
VPSATTTRVKLPKEVLAFRNRKDCWLMVAFRLKKDAPWAKAGHLIAWYQSRLSQTEATIPVPIAMKTPASASLSPLEFSSTRLAYKISSPSTTMTIDRVRGQVSSWTYKDQPILVDTRIASHNAASPSPMLALDFWRPPTDNDAAWQTGEWKHYGLHLMTSRLKTIKAYVSSQAALASTQSSATLGREMTGETATASGVKITVQAEHALAPPSLAWHFDVVSTYTFTTSTADKASGSSNIRMRIHTHLTPRGGHPPNLPRIGHNIQLAPLYTHVKWCGRGPLESYNDKKLSQPVGIWQWPINDMAQHYEVPQENGNRSDVRWCHVSTSPFAPGSEQQTSSFSTTAQIASAELQDLREVLDPSRTSLRGGIERSAASTAKSSLPALRASYITGPHADDRPNMQFAMQLYDPVTIETAKHPCDLLEPGKMRAGALWRLDADVAGVGTAACGPGTEQKNQVQCREREWTLVLEAW